MCASFFRKLLLFCLGLLVLPSGCTPRGGKRPLRVAAASDVEPAFVEIARLYMAKTGHRVAFSFASSSLLAQQVRHGAPYDLFAAANRELLEKLEAQGAVVRGSLQPYARGRLVMWVRKDAELPKTLDGLRDARYQRIALANPEHAPYGQAAVAALRGAGLFAELERRLVYAENVRQAHQYVESRNADVAIGALSLAIATGDSGHHEAVSESLYPPLVQVLGLVTGGDVAAAQQFAALVIGPDGQEILKRHGFAAAP